MKIYIENIKIALRNIKGNKPRSILTMLIISFGITALVSILTATDALKRSINSNFSNVGATSYSLSYRSRGVNFGGSKRKYYPIITYKEASKYKDFTANTAKTTIFFYGASAQTMKYGEKETSPNISVLGCDENYFDVEGKEIEIGRVFSKTETHTAIPIAVIGFGIAKKLFKTSKNALDKQVKIGSNTYAVIGVLKESSEGRGFSVNNNVFLPMLLAKQHFVFNERSMRIKSKSIEGIPIPQAMEESMLSFRKIRRLKPLEENNFVVENSNSMLESLTNMLDNVSAGTSSIGILTLIGAIVALMNIMLVSVTERTREIGVRKSLGASSKMVMTQFLMEAIIISVLGGIFGIIFGICIGNIVAFFMDNPFFVPWFWVSLAFVLCIIMGVISGYYPAKRAASLQPVEALRHDS
ncbi:MAG: ABC transporter permease [Flavobacteriales bacterium]